MNVTSAKSSIDDRIWITYKTRMISERKALNNNKWSLLLLTYYSLLGVFFSVFFRYYESKYFYLSEISIFLSVLTLSASLIVSVFGFENKANTYRSCYLSLQQLYAKNLSLPDKESEYHKIISQYPNHSEEDFYDFVVSCQLRGEKIQRDGKPLEPNIIMYISFFWRKIIWHLFILFNFGISVFLLCPYMLGI